MNWNYQNIKSNKILINFIIIISFILLSLLSIVLLLKNNVVYIGYDTQFHFKRIMELKETLIHSGNILPDFSFNEFHGSSVLTLYPYINLIPAVILSFVIKSKITLVYSFFIFNIFLTFIISFYTCKNYVKSYLTSYVFTVIYGLSNTFLSYNFIGNDFGLVSSYMFMPIIIFGFMKIIKGENSWIELSLGMSLLLFSHILNVFIISLFLLMIFLINYNKLNKYIIVNLIKAIFLFLIITSVIWLPFLYFYFNNLNNVNFPPTYQLGRIGIKDFISGLYGSESNNTMGAFVIISSFISIFFYRHFDRYNKQLYLLSIIIILSTLLLPWHFITSRKIFSILTQFQGVYRLFIMPQMILSFIFSLIITHYIKFRYIRNILCIFSIIMAIFLQLVVGQYFTINKFSKNPNINSYLKQHSRFININDILNYKIENSSQFNYLLKLHYEEDDDYIPKSVLHISPYVNRNIGFYNNNYKIKVDHIGYNTFKFPDKDNISKLSLPIYAYNKEKLYIYLNNKLVNYYINKDGLLMINNIQNNIKPINKIYIKPILSPFRVIGAILSIFALIFILIIIISRNIHN